MIGPREIGPPKKFREHQINVKGKINATKIPLRQN